MPAEFRHSLDLALRLVDTATGRVLAGRDLELRRDGRRVRPLEKEDGYLIFLGEGRRDFDLSVRLRGYEPRQVRVAYAALDKALPLLELHLIPGKGYAPGVPCFSLEGTCPGITALDAVRAGDSACLIREFDPRKRLVTLFNPHKLELDRTFYALVDPDRETYEPFRLVKRIDFQVYKTDRVIETRFGNYFPVCPMVFGGADPDGGYRLRVRDETAQARWIVRWEAGGQTFFQTVDFHRPETLTLKGGG